MREFGGNSFSSLTVTGDLEVHDTTTGSASTGGSLRLSANDGAPMGDSHRLGVIEFTGAEDSSNTQVVGARIEALTDAAWTNAENGCALYFYTTDGNAAQTNVLKIDSNQKSTFTGNVQVNGDIDLTGGFSFDAGTAVTSIDTDLSSVSGSDDTLASAKAVKAYVDSVAGAAVDLTSDVTGTLPVGNGGTGATTLTDGGVLLGSGTGAITASAVLANGELLIGDNSGDPTVATLSAGDGIDITNGAGSITIAAEESSASNKGAVIVAGGTDCTVTYSSGTATVAVDDLAASKITTGTMADARISQSSVTQHQGSIVGVGALNSGSITSGFGNIDVGSSTIDTTGAVGTGNLTAAGDIIATGGDLTLGTSADSADASVKAADESGTDTAGKKLAIQGGLGTGSGASGAVEISVGIPAGSGSSVQSAALAVKVEAAGTSTFYGGTANLANDSGVGEIVTFGTEGSDSLAAGRLMVLNASGVWVYADADAEATTINLLAIALGTAVSDGLLVRGYFKLNTYIEGSFAKGAPCYVSESPGEVDFTKPSAAGDFVRILGHGTDTTNVIMFNPSGNWIEL